MLRSRSGCQVHRGIHETLKVSKNEALWVVMEGGLIHRLDEALVLGRLVVVGLAASAICLIFAVMRVLRCQCNIALGAQLVLFAHRLCLPPLHFPSRHTQVIVETFGTWKIAVAVLTAPVLFPILLFAVTTWCETAGAGIGALVPHSV